MKPANPRILTINGGSSSIKFALFEAGDSLRQILEGGIDRIGLPEAALRVKGLNRADNFSRLVTAPDHIAAVTALMDWIEERSGRDALTAVGHRVVHGGPKYSGGMTVDEATALHAERDGKTFYFCCDHCRQKVLSTPTGAKPEGKSGCCCGWKGGQWGGNFLGGQPGNNSERKRNSRQ